MLLDRVDSRHRGTKRALQVLGPLLLVGGGLLTLIGFADFTSGFGGDAFEDDSPFTGFWMMFIGLPLLSFGWTVCKVAFLGEISRYAAAEVAPPARDALRYVGVGKPEATCTSCGAANHPGSRFCSSCGSKLTSPCPSCGHENDPAARFCGGCGQSLAETTATASRGDADESAGA